MSKRADIEEIVMGVLDTFQYTHQAIEFHDEDAYDAIDLSASIMTELKAAGHITY